MRQCTPHAPREDVITTERDDYTFVAITPVSGLLAVA